MTPFMILIVSFVLVLTLGQVCALAVPALRPVQPNRDWRWRRHARNRRLALRRRRP